MISKFATAVAILVASNAAFAASVPAPQTAEPAASAAPTSSRITSFEQAKACLEKICITYQGQTACLRNGLHFQAVPEDLEVGPDDFGTRVVGLRRGLLKHRVWQTRENDILACSGKKL